MKKPILLYSLFISCLLLILPLGIYQYIASNIEDISGVDSANIEEKQDKLTSKHQMYDHLFESRTYPDFTFDYKAYQKTVRQSVTNYQLAKLSVNEALNTPWRLEGPTNIGGRLNCVTYQPDNPNIIYTGAAKGGVFKTTDGGENWQPIFDEQPFLAISHITIDPNNYDVIYVGTGDVNISSHYAVGDGVYRSEDGGNTWQHLGLAAQAIVAKVLVHPSNSNIIYVATMGNPIARSSERGLYRSTDYGETWEQILYIDDDAGVADLMIDFENPDILYAASWNRIRNNQESIVNDDDAVIWKTIDGGDTWLPLTNDLPTTDMGRIGLCMSHTNPNTIFAIYVSESNALQGVFKSTNAGENWTQIAFPEQFDGDPLGNFGWYFAKVGVNPADDNEVYLLGVNLHRTQNNGETWEMAAPEWWEYLVHADKHAITFIDSNTILLATDGGLYRTNDNCENWEDIENLPNTQFYRVASSPHEGSYYMGGAQDNGTTGGNYTNSNEWPRISGGDGFQPVFDQENPDVFYTESQFGNIRITESGGAGFSDFNNGIDGADRTAWDTPYLISKHNNENGYRGTYRMYANQMGYNEEWIPISDDLTDGIIYHPRHHNITALAESPINDQYIYAGTSDANVWRSLDMGTTWEEITNNLPERYVTSIQASPTDENTAYVTLSGYKGNWYEPHVFKTTNSGDSWEDISGNLPNVGVNDIFIYPNTVSDSILFVANDIGVYVSLDAGNEWQRLGNNMPFVFVFDLDLDLIDNRVVAATFARSIMSYSLDSVLLAYNELTSVGVHMPPLTNETISYQTFSVYPNPSSQFIIIPPLSNKVTQAFISDVNGRVVKQLNIQDLIDNYNLAISDLSNGIYFLHINSLESKRTAKFVKN